MKDAQRRFWLIIVMMLTCVSSMLAGTLYRVSDNYVTVFADPNRINALGRLNRDEVFEATGMDGSLLIFQYKGQKAYVASYCCKEITEEATGNETTSSEAVKEVAEQRQQQE